MLRKKLVNEGIPARINLTEICNICNANYLLLITIHILISYYTYIFKLQIIQLFHNSNKKLHIKSQKRYLVLKGGCAKFKKVECIYILTYSHIRWCECRRKIGTLKAQKAINRSFEKTDCFAYLLNWVQLQGYLWSPWSMDFGQVTVNNLSRPDTSDADGFPHCQWNWRKRPLIVVKWKTIHVPGVILTYRVQRGIGRVRHGKY